MSVYFDILLSHHGQIDNKDEMDGNWRARGARGDNNNQGGNQGGIQGNWRENREARAERAATREEGRTGPQTPSTYQQGVGNRYMHLRKAYTDANGEFVYSNVEKNTEYLAGGGSPDYWVGYGKSRNKLEVGTVFSAPYIIKARPDQAQPGTEQWAEISVSYLFVLAASFL